MNARGFTIIETVVYLGLCGAVLGAALPTAYALVRNEDRVRAAAAATDEALVIDRELRWAAADAAVGAGDVVAPSPTSLLFTLADGSETRFETAGTVLAVSRNGEPPHALNVVLPVTSARFAIEDDGSSHAVLAADIVLGDTPFSFRYPLPPRGIIPLLCSQP